MVSCSFDEYGWLILFSLQEARVAVLKEIFQNRQIETDKINQERVEKIWQQKLAEKDAVKHKSERKKRLGKRCIQ